MCKACKADWRAGRVAGGSFEEMRAACREAKRPGPPAALRPLKPPTFADLPGARRPAWMTDGPLARKGRPMVYPNTSDRNFELPAGRWWDVRCVFEMTEAQQRAELDRQLNRLKGSE